MLSLRDRASVEGAPVDPCPKRLIHIRLDQLQCNYGGDLGDIVSFLVIEPGDSLPAITEKLGFSLLRNLVDGTTFGEPDFTPSWEWMQCHGAWFELVYILTDDGFGTVVFVPNDPAIEFVLHSLCLEYACRETGHA